MAPTTEPLAVDEPTALPPFNPLQSSHKHLYTKSNKQRRSSQEENTNERKASKRASRRMSSNPPTDQPDATNVKRRASRLGMFAFFNRHKPEFEVAEPRLETQQEEDEDDKTQKHDIEEPSVKDNPPQSERNGSAEAVQPTALDSLKHRASKRALKTKDSFTRQNPAHWEPPPLFQVYPQAVKHASLRTPVPPAEAVIKFAQERQNKQSQHADGEGHDAAKQHKDRKLHKSQVHELVSSKNWGEKVFVLVTEGYLLQYSGSGNYERLPEKILPLCSVTAAFATDAIPGKPYVLQIAQISDEDGTINTEISKDTLKKASLKNEVKRAASAILLVLEDPREMNAWLVAVRREIMSFGGRMYKQEVFGSNGVEDEEVEEKERPSQGIQRMPSDRYLVKRDPNRFSLKPPEVPTTIVDERTYDRGRAQVSKGPATNRYSMATTDSTNSRYISDTTASIDQVHLDRLRESPRQSYASVDAKTASTSRCSSVERSPVTERKASTASETVENTNRSYPVTVAARSSTSQVRDRDSQQSTPTAPSVRSVTTPTAVARIPSPPTPNFSVPSFSKRYSVATNASSQPESPKMPTRSDEGTHFEGQAPVEERPRSSHKSARRTSGARNSDERLSTASRPLNSSKRPSSSGSDARYARRRSSLNYARGISPVPLTHHSLAPHPPPTTSLPPIPTQISSDRSPTTPPPKGPPPPPPVQQSDVSLLPVLSSDIPKESQIDHRSLSASQPVTATSPAPSRKLRRPVSMQVRPRPPTPPNTHHAPQPEASKIRFPFQDKPRRNSLKASKPALPPPLPASLPPLMPPKGGDEKEKPSSRQAMPDRSKKPEQIVVSSERIGKTDPLSPFHIPPIKLSDRQSRGSLDGPWNQDYGASKRTYLDLTKS